ncbi:GNAT family N-acetyltransferase [Brooklawnia sp.]|uniref:GNAT family N-acetyltransferase n=1 Tax=Brooklawnia sp. TaxID=2699740 RepID=UPI00311ED066
MIATPSIQLHRASWSELSLDEFYEIARLRYAVFALEQRVDDEDLDGRDDLPDTEHWWFSKPDTAVVCYLRVLRPADDEKQPVGVPAAAWVIGRMATAQHARGQGLAHDLLEAVLMRRPEQPFLLHAQLHARGLYERLGFVPFGEVYDEAGIQHIGMYRAALASRVNT